MKQRIDKTSIRLHSYGWSALFLFCLGLLPLLTACSLMDEDRDDCPMGLYVTFVYDYNTEQADLRKDQVGGITCYVIDEDGTIVASRSVENTPGSAPLSQYGYQMTFPELAPGNYRLVAVGGQQGYETLLGQPGAKFRRIPELGVGDNINDLRIRLDRQSADTSIVYRSFSKRGAVRDTLERRLQARVVSHQRQGLDTLWHTLVTDTVWNAAHTDYQVRAGEESLFALPVWTVRFQKPTYAVVPLIRDTKEIHVSVKEFLNTANEPSPDYDVFITADNGELGPMNSLVPGDRLLYLPFAQRKSEYLNGEDAEGNVSTFPRTAESHFDFTTSRLVLNEDAAKDAQLFIVNRKTRRLVYRENLSNLLVSNRTAPEIMRYTPQGFLDRRHNYDLQFFLLDGEWQYVQISVGILKWTVRTQLEELNS